MRRILWNAANALLFVAFVFSVIVQLNDPDPLPWMAMYGAAAITCAFALLRRPAWWFPAIVAAIALVWAATLAPRVIGQVPFMDMFGAFEMKDIGVEESREMYGLLIIAVWMIALAVVARRRRVA